jgi:hypothetical protein
VDGHRHRLGRRLHMRRDGARSLVVTSMSKFKGYWRSGRRSRHCRDCGEPIGHRHGNAIFCRRCAAIRRGHKW